MDKDERLVLLSKLLHELFEIAPEKIVPDADLFKDLDIDSIDAVDLAVELRKQTGRQLTPEEFKKIRTVADVLEILGTPPAGNA